MISKEHSEEPGDLDATKPAPERKKQLIRTDVAFTGTGVVATYDMDGDDVQKVMTFEKGGQS